MSPVVLSQGRHAAASLLDDSLRPIEEEAGLRDQISGTSVHESCTLPGVELSLWPLLSLGSIEPLTIEVIEMPSANGAFLLTVLDCFKYRNKIGLDVALEALRDGWARQKFTMDEIWHFATVDRVANVMRPYLESVTT